MRRVLGTVVLLWFLSLPSPPARATGDGLPPLHATRVRALDIEHIVAKLRVEFGAKPSAGQLIGQARIRARMLRDCREIALDAAKMQILTVQDQAGRALRFDYDGSAADGALRIDLAKQYDAGSMLELQIDYRSAHINESDPNNLGGSVGQGVRYFSPSTTEPRRRRQIWVASEPEGARYWLPGLDTPADLRTLDLTLTVPAELSGIAVGELVGQGRNADGTQYSQWRLSTPQAHARSAFVVGEFSVVSQQSGATPILNYGYADELEATRASVERLPDMMAFFSQYTGTPYPFPSYRQVMVQELPWGMAASGLAIQTENMVDDFDTHAEFLYLWDGLAAESLAAQWFGGALSPRDWSDVWLARGFAHYFDGLYTEKRNGRSEFLLWYRRGDHATNRADWGAGLRSPVVTRNYLDAASFVASNAPSVRGGMVLHMLRKVLGDRRFQRAIQHYLAKHRGGLVSTQDFIDAIEESSGESLAWFFDQWLYRVGQPNFVITHHFDAKRARLLLQVKQTQQREPASVWSQVEWFQGPVEIELDGRIEKVWLQPQAEQTFEFALTQAPRFVHFDFEESWIKTLVHTKSIDELMAQLRWSTDPAGRSWAMTELLNAAQAKTTPARKRRAIMELLLAVADGREGKNGQATDPYWRIRYNALVTLNALLAPTDKTQALVLTRKTQRMLRGIILRERQWVKAQAVHLLGATRDSAHASLYLSLLDDQHDRVINAAAIALGRSGDPRALGALLKLPEHPSWKNQSLISALNGLRELGDPAGAPLALHALTELDAPRWTLAVSRWDYRLAAAETLQSLGAGAKAYKQIAARLQQALRDAHLNDVFSNLLVLASLGDARGGQWLGRVRKLYPNNPLAQSALDNFESQFKDLQSP